MTLGIQLTDTVNLGVVCLTAAIALGAIVRGLWVAPTKIENGNLRRQLGDAREEIASLDEENLRKDRRLNDLGAEKDSAQSDKAAAEARAIELRERLEALPDWPAVQEFTLKLLEHVDEKAAERQNKIVENLADRDGRLIEMAEAIRAENAERYERLQSAHQAIIEAVTKLVAAQKA